MTQVLPVRLVRSLALALAGTAAVGACLAVPWGPSEILSRAATTPILLLGVPVLMLPSLYLGAGMSGMPLTFRGVGPVDMTSDIATRVGVALLCFTPVLLFLVVSIDIWVARLVLQWTALGLCGAAVLFVVHDELKPKVEHHAGFFVFLAWAACVLAIQIGLRVSSF